MLSCPVSPVLLHIVRKLPSVQSMNKRLLTKNIVPIPDCPATSNKAADKAIMERNSASAITSPKRGALDRKAKLLPNPSIDEGLPGAVVSSGAPELCVSQWIAHWLGTVWHT